MLVGSSSSNTDHKTPKPVLMKLAVMDAMGGTCWMMRINIQYARPEVATPSTSWYPTYFSTFAGAALTNFGTVLATTLAQTGNPNTAIGNAVATTQANFANYHAAARLTADGGRRLVPGTAGFNAAVEAIKNKALPAGAKFTDKSALYHYEGMYNFTE